VLGAITLGDMPMTRAISTNRRAFPSLSAVPGPLHYPVLRLSICQGERDERGQVTAPSSARRFSLQGSKGQ